MVGPTSGFVAASKDEQCGTDVEPCPAYRGDEGPPRRLAEAFRPVFDGREVMAVLLCRIVRYRHTETVTARLLKMHPKALGGKRKRDFARASIVTREERFQADVLLPPEVLLPDVLFELPPDEFSFCCCFSHFLYSSLETTLILLSMLE